MGLDSLFHDVLTQRESAIPYHFEHALAERYPERHHVHTTTYLDVAGFVRAGECTLELQERPRPGFDWFVAGEGERLVRSLSHAAYRVTWQGQGLDLFRLTYKVKGCRTVRHIAVADEPSAAKGFMLACASWSTTLRQEIWRFADGQWDKSQELYASIHKASFDDLVLAGDLKQRIVDDFDAFLGGRETYERYNIPFKRGVLLVGPPGNGKTHCVKAIVRRLGLPCLYVQTLKTAYDSIDSCIRRVFERARRSAPCVLILEDLDAMITPGCRSVFLNELDGFADNDGVITLATTNHPDRLDPAIVARPSRFDVKYHFLPPSSPERMAYLRMRNDHLEASVRLGDGDLEALVEATSGFSFAYLKELVVSSTLQWVAAGRKTALRGAFDEMVVALREQMNSAPPEELTGCAICEQEDGTAGEMMAFDSVEVCEACVGWVAQRAAAEGIG